MLTQRPKQLQRDGLLTRAAYAGLPLRVEYALAPSAAVCTRS
ncbi:winged helix-turn-helix transcriptional regulator [Streptacidiphilus neutrinimicus]|nr:winged helix-turn-helix transcriptional regulator [Streptacidiphilus neutrinimicus]